MTEQELQTQQLLFDRMDEYVKVFGDMTFSDIESTDAELISIIDRALASGEPVYDDVPEGAII